jgi:GNAT superfamily N-acetyltransferase
MLGESRVSVSRAGGLELLTALSGTGGDLDEALARLFADPTAVVCVGEYEGVAAGFAIARQLADAAGGAPLAIVLALWVDPGLRRVGVGEAMIGLLEDWAAASGAHGLDVMALPGSRDAKSLLEALGYKARALVMHRRLDDAGA